MRNGRKYVLIQSLKEPRFARFPTTTMALLFVMHALKLAEEG